MARVTKEHSQPAGRLPRSRKSKDKRVATQRTSREAILEAAVTEFSERGFDGARMEAVAARAGYNKSLVYRYFTDKKGLFEAVLRFKVQQRAELARRMPTELAAIVEFWFHQTLRDPDYLRMLIREALNDTGGELVEEPLRRAYYREFTESIRAYQKVGRIGDEYDPAYFNLGMTALALFPTVFPQLTRMITQQPPDSPEFHRKWEQFLKTLAEEIEQSDPSAEGGS